MPDFITAIADALRTAERSSEGTVAQCPECFGLLIIDLRKHRPLADHDPPACAAWNEWLTEYRKRSPR